jgi:hypothetical protein
MPHVAQDLQEIAGQQRIESEQHGREPPDLVAGRLSPRPVMSLPQG